VGITEQESATRRDNLRGLAGRRRSKDGRRLDTSTGYSRLRLPEMEHQCNEGDTPLSYSNQIHSTRPPEC